MANSKPDDGLTDQLSNRVRTATQRLWAYLWRLNEQTKAYLTLDGPAIVEDLDGLSEEERRLARKAFADGGHDLGETAGDGQDRDVDGGTDGSETAAGRGDVGSTGGGNGGNGGDDGGNGDDESPFDVGGEYKLRQKIGFGLGPLLFALIFFSPTPEGLTPEGQAVAAVTAWVAAWWMSEAIPIPATSLLPIVLFPLTGGLPVEDTTPSYADPLIFLFMGGFFLAMAMQRWGLHRRIALRTISAVGTEPSRLILGFMLATAFLSMWVSNSATVMMMVPIALAVIYQTADLVEETNLDIDTSQGNFSFGVALMLCIAYGASVGGVGTLIGTPPNILFAGQAGELFGETIGFAEWMLYGVPISIVGLVTVYLYVTRLAMSPEFDELPIGADTIDRQLEELGSMSSQERMVLVVFVGMALSWIGASLVDQFGLLPVPEDVDTIVAIAGAMVLFTLPTTTEDGEHTFLLDWSNAVDIPWGVILLFGGGLAIAAGFGDTGLAAWIGEQLALLEGVSMILILFSVVLLTVFLTEVTSNTATTAMLMPILAGVAVGIGVHPFGLMIAGATAASFAFMLPVATPPNAIVFGSGYITLPQMARVGIGLNVIGIILITLVALFWLPIAWGIDLTTLPTEFVEAWGS
ncbi:SLC13 family permease [Natronorubrum texcoconense]|uniref:Solute carrier family 13 (Sodium-dependent dicarboxylate transporter), member 2/3/5 n=1 Tax=Natronorubrum texcoconense TaxID=1095776 RepID=A0A1G8UHN9_9EURY|nr:SLC13 family permease [Natronorubrum texcoconense]SDJ53376.1 solute carrier family 13 (sodium-dependent dicarboxylate transporter), member 2/3/5 [Natronorubrum texcoconense]